MRFKKIGCGLLAVFLSLPLAAPVNSHAAGRFSDTAGHWAEDYINDAVNENFINGYPDGRFRPNKAVTRAEFAAMVNKALGNNATESISFRDVRHGDWYYNDVSKALAAAYTAGYDDNTFRPNNPITRQEAAVMISRIVPAYGEGGNLRVYPDRDRIADWAYESLAKVNGKGYIGAYSDGRIHPTDQLTRAQTAKIICEIIDHENIVRSNTVLDDDGDKISNKIYSNNVTIDEDLGDDSATIENCVILGTLNVKGGGTDSITVSNSRIANASVNRDDDPVRVVAKGETAVVRLSASKESILQTSGLRGGLFGPGFSSITVNNSADVTLRGSFPRINVSGTRAEIHLDTGTIENLIVGGRYSDITADSGTTIRTATVNAESYFHGSGTISQMNVNADDVTYETKPKHWTIAASADTPRKKGGSSNHDDDDDDDDDNDDDYDIAFSPKNGATNVRLDAEIKITFDSSVEWEDGDSIDSSDVDDFIELRKGSSSGSLVDFSAAISSSKKVITVTPDHLLSDDTKYYLIIEGDSIQDDDGDDIDQQKISFTTGDDYDSVSTSYSPANGSTTVTPNPSITIAFSEAVVRYSNGSSISSNDSYLKDCIVFRKDSAWGEPVSYSAAIDSADKVISIYPSSPLALNQKYYLAVASNTLRTKDDGEKVPATSVTWTTGMITPVLSNFSVAPGDTTITPTMTPNVAGRIYAVVLPNGAAAPTAAQIAAGQNSSGVPALGYTKNENATANTAVTLSAIGGLGSGVTYDVWATLYSTASGAYSSPVKQSATTTLPRAALTSLTVRPVVSGSALDNMIAYNPAVSDYTVNLNSSITVVEITAVGNPSDIVGMAGNGLGTVTSYGALTRLVDIAANPVVAAAIAAQGKTSSSYTIHLNSITDTSLKSLKIGNNPLTTGNSSFTFPLGTKSEIDVSLDITTNDTYALITSPAGMGVTISTVYNNPGSAGFLLKFPEGSYPVVIQFHVVSGKTTSPPYTVIFTRPQL